MDFWISDWISGFHSGFLDFTVDFWISAWISGFLDFSLDFCRRCTRFLSLIGVTSSKHSLCTFTMYQLQHSLTVPVIEHGHCSYDQFHKLYYLLLQCLPYTNAMQCCSFLCLYYNTSSPIFPLKQYSMHFTTESCQAVANKGQAIASKLHKRCIFLHT